MFYYDATTIQLLASRFSSYDLSLILNDKLHDFCIGFPLNFLSDCSINFSFVLYVLLPRIFHFGQIQGVQLQITQNCDINNLSDPVSSNKSNKYNYQYFKYWTFLFEWLSLKIGPVTLAMPQHQNFPSFIHLMS